MLSWALVKGFNVSYQNKETILFSVDPYYGNLIKGFNVSCQNKEAILVSIDPYYGNLNQIP